MSNKIKIFSDKDPEDLEKKVNNFLKSIPEGKIRETTYKTRVTSPEYSYSIRYSI
jgi:hypothetical protein